LTPFHFNSLRDGKVLAMFFCALFVSFIVISFFLFEEKNRAKDDINKSYELIVIFLCEEENKEGEEIRGSYGHWFLH